jgi:hypothetical protein
MSWAKAADEVPMRPGVIHVITRVVFSGIVTNPDLAINVRRIGVTGFIAVVATGVNSMRCALNGRGAVRWRSLVPATAWFIVLGKRWN